MATLWEHIDGATKVPWFESYRGFLFGSLNPDVPSLEEHLGGAKAVIDQIVDGAPDAKVVEAFCELAAPRTDPVLQSTSRLLMNSVCR